MHTHNHSPTPHYGKAFTIGILANSLFILAEFLYSLKTHSLALMADAGHNVSDVLGLLLAWGAFWLGKQKPSNHYTYGFGSSSIIAALSNAVFLLVITGGILWESIQRFYHPALIPGYTVMGVAAVGILVNGGSALLFMKAGRHDINLRGAFLHLSADALISLGVVVSGFITLHTGWYWLDPLVSILISLVIILSTWKMLKEAFKLAMHGVPPHIDHQEVKAHLLQQQGVREVHDLHIWAMSTTETALSVHLVMAGGHPGDLFLHQLAEGLGQHFHIGHSTIQIEVGDGENQCRLAGEEVV